MTPQSIRPEEGALLIEGPQGDVRLQLKSEQGNTIVAQYQGQQLVNGSARAYSQQMLEEAIVYTQRFPLPWEIDADGTQRITNHQQFYAQSFKPELAGIETLRRWLGPTK
jgi:hypothetical protein